MRGEKRSVGGEYTQGEFSSRLGELSHVRSAFE